MYTSLRRSSSPPQTKLIQDERKQVESMAKAISKKYHATFDPTDKKACEEADRLLASQLQIEELKGYPISDKKHLSQSSQTILRKMTTELPTRFSDATISRPPSPICTDIENMERAIFRLATALIVYPTIPTPRSISSPVAIPKKRPISSILHPTHLRRVDSSDSIVSDETTDTSTSVIGTITRTYSPKKSPSMRVKLTGFGKPKGEKQKEKTAATAPAYLESKENSDSEDSFYETLTRNRSHRLAKRGTRKQPKKRHIITSSDSESDDEKTAATEVRISPAKRREPKEKKFSPMRLAPLPGSLIDAF